MAKLHFLLKGNEGVGKSETAALLARWKFSNGATLACSDADPVNAISHGYAGLNVHRLHILTGEEIDPRSFDGLVIIPPFLIVPFTLKATADTTENQASSNFAAACGLVFAPSSATVPTEGAPRKIAQAIITIFLVALFGLPRSDPS